MFVVWCPDLYIKCELFNPYMCLIPCAAYMRRNTDFTVYTLHHSEQPVFIYRETFKILRRRPIHTLYRLTTWLKIIPRVFYLSYTSSPAPGCCRKEAARCFVYVSIVSFNSADSASPLRIIKCFSAVFGITLTGFLS